MEELSRPVTLTELAAALGGSCSVHSHQDAPWLNSLQNAQFWHPEMQRYGRETLLVLPHTSLPETLDALAVRAHETVTARFSVPAVSVALCPVGSLPRTATGKVRRRPTRALLESGDLPVRHSAGSAVSR